MKKTLYFAILASFCACNSPEGGVERDSLTDATQDTAVMYDDDKGRIEADGVEIKTVGEDYWNNVNWDAPVVEDPEMKTANVEKREDDKQTMYTLDDRLLFDTDKAQLRSEADDKLNSIAEEIKGQPQNSPIRIFGHADARASNEYNKELSRDRANAVKSWLTDKGGIDASRISIEAMGETDPRATNETAKGRQLNRRVAIVVARGQ